MTLLKRRWATRSDPNRSSRFRPEDSNCLAAASTRSEAWRGPVAEPFARSKCPPTVASTGTTPRSKGPRSAWRMRDSHISGTGTEKKPTSSRVVRTNWVRSNPREHRSRSILISRWTSHSACRDWTTRFSPGESRAMGACTMGMLRALLFVWLMGVCTLAQSPGYGVGRTPTAEEIRAWDISIGPTGEELPPGRGTAKEGALVYRAKGCASCHGATGIGGRAPILKSKVGPEVEIWKRERILALRAPFATTVWDYLNRAMPLDREGTLTADEGDALTAFLLYINDVIPENEILDAQSLPKVRMPIGDKYASLPEWKPRTRRLKGYPY